MMIIKYETGQSIYIYDYTPKELSKLSPLTLNIVKFRNSEIDMTTLEFLFSSSTLRELDLKQNHLSETIFSKLCDLLKTNTTLVSLNLYGNRITDTALNALIQALIQNQALLELDLGFNGITSETAIVELIRQNKTLQKLYLNENHFQNSANRIFNALQENAAIHTFNLASNNIGPHLEPLLDVFKINKTLQILDISDNQIGDVGAITLSQILEMNPSLNTLKIAGNHITHTGLFALSNALTLNSPLEKLNLARNEFSEQSAQAFLEMVKTNGTLKKIDFYPNDFNDHMQRTIQAIQQYCQYNQLTPTKSQAQNLKRLINKFTALRTELFEHPYQVGFFGIGGKKYLKKRFPTTAVTLLKMLDRVLGEAFGETNAIHVDYQALQTCDMKIHEYLHQWTQTSRWRYWRSVDTENFVVDLNKKYSNQFKNQ